MSDDEQAGGFGSASESEDEGGFGGDASESEEEDGFGDLKEDFGESEDEDDGGGFGDADESDEEDAAPKAPPTRNTMLPTTKSIKRKKSEKDMAFGLDDGLTAIKEANKEPQEEIVRTAANDYVLYAKANLKGTHNYQLEVITEPMTNVGFLNANTALNQVFVSICQWMGITAVVGKTEKATMDVAADIINPGIFDPSLRDEIFCQIMKQMTNNPARMSAAKGVILLSLVIGVYTPSDTLMPIVTTFIADGPSGFKAYLELLLNRTTANGPRKEPPCQLEFNAAKHKQIMRVKVQADLMTRHHRKTEGQFSGTDIHCAPDARLDPASTNQEWTEEICRSQAIEDPYGWSVYVKRFGTEISLHGIGGAGMHVMDAISKIDQKARKEGGKTTGFIDVHGQFSLRKEFFAKDHDCLLDPYGTAKIYHQIQAGIKEGIYVPAKKDYYTYMAQAYYIEFGSDIDEEILKPSMLFWSPKRNHEALQIESGEGVEVVEKIHATSEYVRKGWNATQVQAEVIRYALGMWGRENSFGANKDLTLSRNLMKAEASEDAGN